mgnify:CR=1 FL=1
MRKTSTTFGKEIEQIMTREGPQRHVQIIVDGKTLSAVVPEKKETLDQLPSFPRPTLVSNDLPRIPWNNVDGGVLQAWLYFKAVYEKLRTEAFLWWHWDREARCYVMLVPAFYYVSSAGLEYPSRPRHFCRSCRVGLYHGGVRCPHCVESRIEEAVIVGTSHSHGSLQPFHSGEDHANELDHTGFHITFGHLDRPLPVAASFVVADAKTRFTTDWNQHFEVDDATAWETRLRLWLTLVSPGRSLIDSSRYQVTQNGQIAFRHGDRNACEIWLKSQIDPSGFSIEENKEERGIRSGGVVDRLVLSSDRDIDTRVFDGREKSQRAYSRDFFDSIPSFNQRKKQEKKRERKVAARDEVPEFWLYQLLSSVPKPLLGCAYAEVVAEIRLLVSGVNTSPSDNDSISRLLSEIPDPSTEYTWLDTVRNGISCSEAVEVEKDEESWGAYNRMLTTVAQHADVNELQDFADWVRSLRVEDERKNEEGSDIF